MTKNQRCKKYLENHPGATVEDWQNQRHRMMIRQAQMVTFGKHTGSKKKSNILLNINHINKRRKVFLEKLMQ